ncbi:MAG: dockerin type I domain-containing protein [Oscillospiraceae bacterium]|nr:dockerin type I domain-containing protein [Oscillospiraceae bacterium]
MKKLLTKWLALLLVLTLSLSGMTGLVFATEEPDPAAAEAEETTEATEAAAAEEDAQAADETAEESAAQEETEAEEAEEVEETEAEEAEDSAPEPSSEAEEDVTTEETAETQAETVDSAEAEVYYEEVVYINPLYADVITEDDLTQPVTTINSALAADVDYDDYGTESEAADTLREGLEARDETITVYIAADYYAKSMTSSVFAEAIEHTGVSTQGDYLKWQYAGYNVSIRYTSESSVYYITITYTVTYYTTAAQEAELTAALEDVMDSLELDSKSEIEKVCAIYEYICENVTYDYDTLYDNSYKLKYTAYAALTNGTAVCQGYALLLYRMMLEAGIDARLIAGNSTTHGWNIVELDDLYYNVDSTWDAGKTTYDYFLLCNDNFTSHTRDEEYDTTAFNTTYPMAEHDYYGCTNSQAHSYVGEVTTAATCTEDGVMTYTCSGCGDAYTETIAAAGHNYVGAVATAATAKTSGVMTYTCSACGNSYTEVISPTADISGDGTVNGRDLVFLRRYLARMSVTINEDAADVNGDGYINGRDLIYLRKLLAA